jgi:hypothetical protein
MSRQAALSALGLSVFDLVVMQRQFVERMQLANLVLINSFNCKELA